MAKQKTTPAVRIADGPFGDLDFVSAEVVCFTDARAGLAKWLVAVNELKQRFTDGLPKGKSKVWAVSFRSPLVPNVASPHYNPIGSVGRFTAVALDVRPRADHKKPVAYDSGMAEMERAACTFFGTTLGLPSLVGSLNTFAKFLKK
jgi:hypothetical protein